LENTLIIKTFTLETVDDCHDNIYAIGMSIASDSSQEVVVFRRDPVSHQATFMSTTTPERALDSFQRVMPMRLVWTQDQDNCVGTPASSQALDRSAGH
jgi:hypothetical protein